MAIKTLMLGFGGTGTQVLTFVKESSVYKFGQDLDSIQFLELDTIADWKPGAKVQIAGGHGAEETIAKGSEASLSPATEYFHLQDRNPNLKEFVQKLLTRHGEPDKYPQFKDWLHTDWLSSNIPPNSLDIVQGAAQQRQIGRFAMFQNVEYIVGELGKRLHSLAREAQGSAVNVWIVASAAGGTGAGCLLDAAYMVHMAAQQPPAVRITLTAVIVLPDVYADKSGISKARAFSLFREIDRLQEIGVPAADRYAKPTGAAQISSEVAYDDANRWHAYVPQRLFDYLTYVGKPCRADADRVAFFSSLANAIDPYVDANVGSQMMEEMVNTPGTPMSFGATRLFIPLNTFADLFSWDLVDEYLKGITAPKEEGGRTRWDSLVVGLQAGSDSDRQRRARERLEQRSELFKQVLAHAEKARDATLEFVSNHLQPGTIVKNWYQFGAPEVAGHRVSQDELRYEVPLAYVNPFYSLDQDQEDVPEAGIRVKTYRENQAAKGIREDQNQSKDRFLKELKDALDQYKDQSGGAGSFERGRRAIYRTVTETLTGAIDALVVGEMGDLTRAHVDPAAPEQGTAFTRLYLELRHMVSPEGPLTRIRDEIGEYSGQVKKEAGQREQEVTNAIATLRQARSSGILGGFGNWVEQAQIDARDMVSQYVFWYQKYRLLDDMRGVVEAVRKRCEAWVHEIERGVTALAVPKEGIRSVMEVVRNDHVRRLEERLHRLSQVAGALISLDERAGDTQMQGFRAELAKRSTLRDGKSLALEELEGTRWVATVDDSGLPKISLMRQGRAVERLDKLGETLRDHFRRTIDQALAEVDIFDYLYFVQRLNMEPEQIVNRLYRESDVLLNVTQQGTCAWVYKNPRSPEKINLAAALQGKLKEVARFTVRDAMIAHSDRTSLTLLKIVEPEVSAITDILDCEQEYCQQLSQRLGEGGDDKQLQRALVYHPFRAELEARFIEHRYLIAHDTSVRDRSQLISPRVVRLLDRPDMMQIFVNCVACGAVVWDGEARGWIWKAPSRPDPVKLTSFETDGVADVIRAAVIFVLRGYEGATTGRIRIERRDAEQSADKEAKAVGSTVRQLVKEFVADANLDAYLAQRLPAPPNVGDRELVRHERDRMSLKLVFQFYGDENVRSDLRSRVLVG